MTKQAIIERTIEAIDQLPNHKAAEIADFADLLTNRQGDILELQKKLGQLKEELLHIEEELAFNRDVQSLASNKSFDFLKDEEDIYTLSDVKQVYGKG